MNEAASHPPVGLSPRVRSVAGSVVSEAGEGLDGFEFGAEHAPPG